MFSNLRATATMKKEKNFLRATILGLLSAVALTGCMTTEPRGIDGAEINDPFENYNRKVFSFNKAVDAAFINPVVKTYKTVVPNPAQTGLDNALKNLRSPTTFMNEVLQGDLDGAGNVLKRAVINTLLGFGGIFDLAGHEGIMYEAEDFGQTLASWGVDHGPYLVVPVIGPSSTRDYAGFFVDSIADPLRWYAHNVDKEGIYYGKVALDYLNLRASLIDVLEELEASSIDYYAATRSAYYQRREALVNDQNPDDAAYVDIPDYDDY